MHKSSSIGVNWKKFQLRFLNADDISCDYVLKQKMQDNPSWAWNLDYASADIKIFADQKFKINNTNFDFFIINDLEFGKLPIKQLESTVVDLYNQSVHGGYFSVQSYYLNWHNQPEHCYQDIDDDMDIAVEQWVRDKMQIKNYTNASLQISNPLKNRLPNGELVAGSDFMYTHGNTRFWLWKK
jgi:hypothetical protein